ncbi:MAG: DUF4382 domain-containing protein [archaeon]|nr:DUF4382 domain-containing protein [archaeon]
MTNNGKKVLTHGLMGFFAAFIIITALIGAGVIPLTPSAEAKGLLVINVKDAPAELEALMLEIDGIKVHKAGEVEGTWMDVEMLETPIQVPDLLSLSDYVMVLATQELTVGSYTEIRFRITSASATIDGTPDIPLRITTEWFMVKTHFEILEESVTSITIDITINEQPIIKAGILMPVAKAIVEYNEEESPILVQNHYRWANDDRKEPPNFIAPKDTPIDDVTVTGEVLRLRLSIRNTGTTAWSGDQLKLQYSINPVDSSSWNDVGEEGADWMFYDGLGEDGEELKHLFLTHSTVEECFVELSNIIEIINEVPVNGQGEWDICIESNDALPGETYFFRLILSDGTTLDYTQYPTLTTTS